MEPCLDGHLIHSKTYHTVVLYDVRPSQYKTAKKYLSCSFKKLTGCPLERWLQKASSFFLHRAEAVVGYTTACTVPCMPMQTTFQEASLLLNQMKTVSILPSIFQINKQIRFIFIIFIIIIDNHSFVCKL